MQSTRGITNITLNGWFSSSIIYRTNIYRMNKNVWSSYTANARVNYVDMNFILVLCLADMLVTSQWVFHNI